MLPELERLLVLQDRDRKIRALKQEQKMAPLERKELEAKLATATRDLESAKHQAKEIEVERKKLENEAQSKRDQIAKFQIQKFQTRKNEEFQALSNEITRYEKEIEQIEDRELELMERAEVVKATATEADKAAQSTRAQVERQIADIEAKIETVEGHLRELDAERAQLAAGVDEELMDTYQRLFSNRGEAVVPLEHEVCMGCHMKVTAQTSVVVKGRKEVVHCEHCGRILYAGES